ncbi:hypothetical protein [Shimia sediminis]|uniref:hypothetical protein n=1 Tax=Shimia sediminis TaxID=2497945 RepID=UPI000F8E49FF|nr:hypothetical protein [Shimia sediminis]
MKPVTLLPRLALVAALAASPVMAEETPEGRSMMEDGILLFLEGLQKQMEPTMDELQTWADELGPALRSFTEEMGPALADLMEQVEDWSAYHPPEVLPNGDIIIRRKQPEEVPQGADEGATDI